MPIIGLSARTSKEDHVSGRAAGMDDYLNKPIEIPQLSRVLEQWLPGRITPMMEIVDSSG
jgi:DNA-binding response OmpR family regulator